MARSSISTALCSEPEDFEAAAWAASTPRLLVTAPGRFKARLTEVALGAMRLSAVEETLPRIAVLTVPADTVLVMLPIGRLSAPIWGGVVSQQREVMTHGRGQRLYGWTDSPCRWGAIWMPAGELAHYGDALTGTRFALPLGTRRWRPLPQSLRTLRNLHAAAIRIAETQPDTLAHQTPCAGSNSRLSTPWWNAYQTRHVFRRRRHAAATRTWSFGSWNCSAMN